MIRGGFVVRCGDGFLFNPSTLSIIRHNRTPRIAARQANRYRCAEDAGEDVARLRRNGMEAKVESYVVACRGG